MIQENSKMPVLDEVKNHSANHANSRVIAGKRFASTNAVGGPSLPAFPKPSQAHPYEANRASADIPQLEAEDTLGCARGILWSLIFEAALALGPVLYWKFHFFSH
jgi:hypothetical protein